MSAAQKFYNSTPICATTAQAIGTTRPAATIFSAPKREISMPVKKLGANMARTCHWMPSVTSSDAAHLIACKRCDRKT